MPDELIKGIKSIYNTVVGNLLGEPWMRLETTLMNEVEVVRDEVRNNIEVDMQTGTFLDNFGGQYQHRHRGEGEIVAASYANEGTSIFSNAMRTVANSAYV